MSFHTPAGFARRCVRRDDGAEHQIRLFKKENDIVVSCTCAVMPIAPTGDLDDAWTKYHEFHDQLDSAA